MLKYYKHSFIFVVLVLLSCSLWEYEDPSNPLEMKNPETYLSLIATDTIFSYIDTTTGDSSFEWGNIPDSNQTIVDTLENAFSDTLTSRQELHWWGEDSDGEVIGYQYRWERDSVWSFTTKESGVFYVPILTQFDVFRFYVAAVDNDSLLDSTPAKLVFPIKNSSPEISFRDRSNPYSSDLPNPGIHYTFPTRTFVWTINDLEGSETVKSVFYALDDTCGTCWTEMDALQYSSITLDSISAGEHVIYFKAKDIAEAYSDIISFPDPDSANYPGTWIVKEPLGDILLVDDYLLDTDNNALNWYRSILDTTENVGMNGYSIWELGNKLPAIKDVTATLDYFNKIIWYAGYEGGSIYNAANGSINSYVEKGGHFFLNFTSFSENTTFSWFPTDNIVSLNANGDIKAGKILIPDSTTLADTLTITSTITRTVKGLDNINVNGFQSLYRLQEPDNFNEDLWEGTPSIIGSYKNPDHNNYGKTVIMSIPLFKTETSIFDFKWEVQNEELDPVFDDMTFANMQTGWLVGKDGVVLKTADGGNTWVEQSTSTTKDLLAVDFINNSKGWAVGKRGTILHTSDGGENWEIQTSSTDKRLYSVDFIDESRGWISGKSGIILSTTDGGENWSDTTLINQIYREVTFVDSQRGWCVGSNGIFLRTEDSGNTWMIDTLMQDYDLYAVFFINENEGWIAGEDGLILKTMDGGGHWYELSSETGETLYDIFFLDSNLGWVVGNSGKILYTDDGGSNWNTEYSGTQHDLKSIHIFDPEHGKVFGEDNLNSIILNRKIGGSSGKFFNFLLNDIFQ